MKFMNLKCLDIQVMINNNEIGSVLRIIEVIEQDELESLDEDTLYFIICIESVKC